MLTNKLIYTVGIILTSTVLFSCQTKTVTPGAERLRVVETEPKGCLYMGEVSTVQENEETVANSKDVDMNLNSRIDLRNKGFAISGNIIIFMAKNKSKVATTNTAVVDLTKKDNKSEPKPVDEKVAQTVFLATVFHCPPNIFNQ